MGRKPGFMKSIRNADRVAICLFLIIAAYAAIVWQGSTFYAAIWDEGTHNFAGIFVHDLIRDFPGIADKSPSGLKDYALDYYTDYKFYQSIYVHPPLYKMFTLPFYFLFGVSIFAVRFPTLLLGIVGIIVAYRFALLLSKRKDVSLLTAFLYAFSQVYLQWSFFGNIDVALSTFVLLSFYWFVKYEKYGRRKDLYILGVLIGLTSLLKLSGLMIIPMIVAYRIFTGKWRSVFSREMITIYILFAVFYVPWVVFTALQPVEYVAHFNYLFGGNVITSEYWAHTLYNLVYFFSLPGIIAIPFAVRKYRNTPLILLWAGLTLAFFMLVTEFYGTLPRYALIVLFPSIFLISSYVIDLKRPLLYAFISIFIVQSLFFSIAGVHYAPVKEAIDYAYENAEPGTGIIVTNANQQFYMMSRDRSREHSVWWFGEENEFDRLLEGGKMPIRGMGQDMDIPPISFVIVDEKKENEQPIQKHIEDIGLEEAARFDYVYPFSLPGVAQEQKSMVVYRGS